MQFLVTYVCSFVCKIGAESSFLVTCHVGDNVSVVVVMLKQSLN